jgi:hypothetical protein
MVSNETSTQASRIAAFIILLHDTVAEAKNITE